MISFKDIIQQFELFTQNHTQINGFDFGDISNLNSNEYNFPMIFLKPIPGGKEKNLTTIKFDMYILDVLEQDRSNNKDILTNTMMIGNDIISKFWIDREESLNFELNEQNIQLTPIEYEFDKLLGGWIFNIEIQMNSVLDNCSIPLFDYNGSGVTCANGTVSPNPFVAMFNTSMQYLEFQGPFKLNYNSYMEFTEDISGNTTNVDYWSNSGKTLKLFSKVITYDGDNPIEITNTDEITEKILTTNIEYSGSTILNITKTYN